MKYKDIMKYILLLLSLCLFIFGCYQKVNHAEIEKARQFCADRGGIDYIREDCLGSTVIYCLNGESEYDCNIEIEKYNKKTNN